MSNNILFIDTSLKFCHVAVQSSEGKIKNRYLAMERGHAKHLVPMIKEVMEKAGLQFSDLDLVVSIIGPGSFTGLRVGLATARGIALATSIPAVGITSFKAIALSTGNACEFEVLIDTKRGDYYAQRFDANTHEIGDPYIATNKSLESVTDDNAVINPKHIFRFVESGIDLSGYTCKPFYMRQAQANPMAC